MQASIHVPFELMNGVGRKCRSPAENRGGSREERPTVTFFSEGGGPTNPRARDARAIVMLDRLRAGALPGSYVLGVPLP